MADRVRLAPVVGGLVVAAMLGACAPQVPPRAASVPAVVTDDRVARGAVRTVTAAGTPAALAAPGEVEVQEVALEIVDGETGPAVPDAEDEPAAAQPRTDAGDDDVAALPRTQTPQGGPSAEDDAAEDDAPASDATPAPDAVRSPDPSPSPDAVHSPGEAPAVDVDPAALAASDVADDAVPADAPEGVTAVDAEDGAAEVRPDPVTDALVSDVVVTDGLQTVGVTWDAGQTARPELEVRTRGTDDTWTSWQPLDVGDEAPDEGTAEAATARAGTLPLWVGEADAVQVRSTGEVVEGLTLSLVSSDTSVVAGASSTADAVVSPALYTTGAAATYVDATDGSTTVDGTVVTDATPTAAGAPAVVTRAQWGAAAPICTPDVVSTLSGAVVHHTAGSNSYTTRAQAMAQIRNDQAYHQRSRGWCDIGYNFVVDKWGNIYEGRAGSLTRAVVGVHASGANTGTVGVSMLGNYDVVATTPAMIDAVGRIVGYRLRAYGVDPRGSGRYPSGLVLPRVVGHRDVTSTACPGRYGYAQLGNIRTIAAAVVPPVESRTAEALVRALYQDLMGRAVDASGLATWTNQLMAGRPPAVVVDTLTQSWEYRRLRISQAYREVFGRDPDESGLQAWTAEVASGRITIDDVKRRLLDSGEFYSRAGGTPRGYVARLYESVLGRSGTDQEVRTWSAAFDQVGRSGIATAIWSSRESAMWRAGLYYPVLLGRSADRGGRETWANVLLRSGESAVRNGLAASGEYEKRALSRLQV